MEVVCRIEVECKNRREARIVEKALRVDNEGYVESRLEGNKIVAVVKEKNAMSALHTINDFLACLQLSMESASILK